MSNGAPLRCAASAAVVLWLGAWGCGCGDDVNPRDGGLADAGPNARDAGPADAGPDGADGGLQDADIEAGAAGSGPPFGPLPQADRGSGRDNR